jgi:surface antigen
LTGDPHKTDGPSASALASGWMACTVAMAGSPSGKPMRALANDHAVRRALPARRRRIAARPWVRRCLNASAGVACWIAAAVAPLDLAAQTDADEEYVQPLVNQALESEKSRLEIPWHNPATGSGGMIMIERTFYRDPRTPCREYRRTLERAGAPAVEVHGTGCRIGPGLWSLEEESARSVAAPAPSAGADAARTPPPAAPPDVEPGAGPAPASCPALSAVPVPCTKPPAVVDYTMPTRTKL